MCSSDIEIPLKSDIVFENYATEEQRIVMQEVIEQVEDRRVGSYNLTQVTPIMLSNKVINVEQIQVGNTVKEFNFMEKTFHDIVRWTDLIMGNFRCSAFCICTANQLSIVTSNRQMMYDLKSISKKEIENLINENIFYQLDATHFLIKAINGDYELEVV